MIEKIYKKSKYGLFGIITEGPNDTDMDVSEKDIPDDFDFNSLNDIDDSSIDMDPDIDDDDDLDDDDISELVGDLDGFIPNKSNTPPSMDFNKVTGDMSSLEKEEMPQVTPSQSNIDPAFNFNMISGDGQSLNQDIPSPSPENFNAVDGTGEGSNITPDPSPDAGDDDTTPVPGEVDENDGVQQNNNNNGDQNNPNDKAPGIEYDSTRKFILFGEFKNIYSSIDRYTERLNSIDVSDLDAAAIINNACTKLNSIKELIYDYMIIRYSNASYYASQVFLEKVIVTIQEIFNCVNVALDPEFSKKKKE